MWRYDDERNGPEVGSGVDVEKRLMNSSILVGESVVYFEDRAIVVYQAKGCAIIPYFDVTDVDVEDDSRIAPISDRLQWDIQIRTGDREYTLRCPELSSDDCAEIALVIAQEIANRL